jgi:phosphoglycerate kinase
MAASACDVLSNAEKHGCTIILPDDVVIADKPEAHVTTRTVAVDAVPANTMILDIGPRSVARIEAALVECKTLVWNGPVGAFEMPPFDRATLALANKVAELTTAGKLLSVAGGGDTVAALAAAGVGDKLSYLSTAGGAFLEWLEGRTLPGVVVLARVDHA